MAVGNLEFINSFSTTSASTLSADNVFTTDYDVYKIVMTPMDKSTDSEHLFRFLDSGGSEISSSNYDYASLEMYGHTGFFERRTTGAGSIAYLGYGDRNQATMYVYNPADTGSYSFVQYQSSGGTSTLLRGEKGIGVLKLSALHRGFIIRANTGTYSDLTVSIYGVK